MTNVRKIVNLKKINIHTFRIGVVRIILDNDEKTKFKRSRCNMSNPFEAKKKKTRKTRWNALIRK